MARSIYRQTDPMEGMSAFGQGLQGLGVAIQAIKERNRMMAEQDALSQSLAMLNSPEARKDYESFRKTLTTVLQGHQRAGLSPYPVLQMALMPGFAPETPRQAAETKGLEAEARTKELHLDIEKALKPITLTTAAVDLAKGVEELQALERAEDVDVATKQARINAIKAQARTAQLERDKMIEDLKVVQDPAVRTARIQQVLYQVQKDFVELQAGKIGVEQAQAFYTPKFFQDLYQEINKSVYNQYTNTFATLDPETRQTLNADLMALMKQAGISQTPTKLQLPTFGTSESGSPLDDFYNPAGE